MSFEPIYVSRPRAKSLWQRAEDLVSVEIHRGVVGLRWAFKLDWADLYRHVAVRKRSGFWKELRITPDDPEAFVAACRAFSTEPSPD